MLWIRLVFKYGLRCAVFYWCESRRAENRPKIVVSRAANSHARPGDN